MVLRELSDIVIEGLFDYLDDLEAYMLYQFAAHLDIVTETVVENNEDGINDLLEDLEPSDILPIDDLTKDSDPLVYKSGNSIYSCYFEDLIDYSDFKEELLDTEVEDIEDALNYIGSDFSLFKDSKLYDTLDGLSNELVFSINKLNKFQDSTIAKEFKDELYALNTKITNAIDEYNNSKKGA